MRWRKRLSVSCQECHEIDGMSTVELKQLYKELGFIKIDSDDKRGILMMKKEQSVKSQRTFCKTTNKIENHLQELENNYVITEHNESCQGW